jgi:hypothetical protein
MRVFTKEELRLRQLPKGDAQMNAIKMRPLPEGSGRKLFCVTFLKNKAGGLLLFRSLNFHRYFRRVKYMVGFR